MAKEDKVIRTGHNAQGHHSHGMRMSRTVVPSGLVKPAKRVGIDRQPRERIAQDLPLAERHEQILEQVGDEPTSRKAIAKALGMKEAGVNSGLYVLQDRGLVTRVPYKGWIRT